jgi:hypothetical protein
MDPCDVKSAILAKRAQLVALVYFPIALASSTGRCTTF